MRAVREAAALLESLGHEVVEADPPWQQEGLMHLFTAAFGPAVSVQVMFASLIAGREPTEEDMEPLSWAIWQLCRSIDSVGALGAEYQLHAFARMFLTWLADYDVAADAGARRAAGDDRHAGPAGAGPDGDVRAVGAVHAVHGGLQRHRLARDLAAAVRGTTACRWPSQLCGQPAQEGALLALAAQLEAAHPWAGRRPQVAASA